MAMLSDKRPWGWYKGVGFSRWWVKLIRVLPGQRTSLQYHADRKELHVCLWPPAVRYVGRYRVHRMTEGLYIELAWGQPREDDIVRLRDDYGRTQRS